MKKIISMLLLCGLLLASFNAAAAESTVGVGDAGFSTQGAWLDSGVTGFNGSKTMYSREGTSSAIFASPLTSAGNAKVEFYNISQSADPELTVQITYSTDQTTQFRLDQVNTPDGWVDLGVYPFDGKESEQVTVIRGRGNTRINCVRFTETKADVDIKGEETQAFVPEETEDTPEEAEEGSLILAVQDSACTKEGDWKESSLTGFGEKPSIYTTETDASVFFASPVKEGNAKVAFYNIQEGSAPGATLVVTYDGDKTYEQKLNQNQTGKGWVSLGTFRFTGAEGEGVRLIKSTAGGYTRASEVKFLPTEEEATDFTPDPLADMGDDDINNIRMEGFEVSSGEWMVSQLRGFNESGSAYCGDVGGTVKWDPAIDTENEVTIYVYRLPYSNNIADALYQVHHDGKVDDVRVNLKEGESGWYKLGTFRFNGKGDEYVTLTKDKETQGESYVRADAVKFIATASTENISNNYTQVIIVDNDPPTYFVDITFDDTETHWAKDQISRMANRKLVYGVSETLFNPDGSISRAEFSALLIRILELEETETNRFTDGEGWFTGSLGAADNAGLYEGFPLENNMFLPGQPITREEMALMIANAGKLKNKPLIAPQSTKTVADFGDGDTVSDFAKDACQYAIDNGVISGYEDNTFRPKNTATRAEATVMLKQFMELTLWAGPVDTSKTWTLTFSDEFNGDAIDWNVWVSENRENKWSAIESSRYPENIAVKDGCLYLLTKKNNPDPSNEWSSGYIWTKEFKQKFGYFEARFMYNNASGINNAFWLMTDGETNGTKPGEHEIDINEGHYPNKSSHNLHYYDKNEKKRVDKGIKKESTENYAKDFHIFACEWTPTEIIFYVDGKEVHRNSAVDTAMEDTASLVRFSTAVSSSFAGKVTDALDGQAMVVDYVRVYQTAYK